MSILHTLIGMGSSVLVDVADEVQNKTKNKQQPQIQQTKPAKRHRCNKQSQQNGIFTRGPLEAEQLTVTAHQLGSVLEVAMFLQKLDLVLLVQQVRYGCQHLLGFAVAVVQPGRLVAEAGDGEGCLWLVVDQRLGHRQALPLKLLQGQGKKENNNGHSGMALLTAWTLTSCPQDRVASGQITR